MPKLALCKYYIGGRKYDPVQFLEKGPNEWKNLLPRIKTCDLIDLAFKSSIFRGFLKQNKTPLKYFKWEFGKSMGIKLTFPDYKSLFIGYMPSNRSLQNGEDLPLDITEIDFKIKKEYLEILQTRKVRSTSPYQVLKTITDVIMDLFIAQDTKLVWNMPSGKGFVDLFLWDHTKHFEEIHFESRGSEGSEALKFLLEEVSTETLNIETLDSSVQCSSPFKSPNLCLYDIENCFKMDSFLKMECQDVEMKVDRIPSSDLNALIKCWINGGLVNLEFLQLTVSKFRSFPIKEEEVLEGIQKTRSNGRIPRRASIPSGVFIIARVGWEEKSFDIFRKSDNKKATVGMHARIFGFAVWP